jgi:hypothetical protein
LDFISVAEADKSHPLQVGMPSRDLKIEPPPVGGILSVMGMFHQLKNTTASCLFPRQLRRCK